MLVVAANGYSRLAAAHKKENNVVEYNEWLGEPRTSEFLTDLRASYTVKGRSEHYSAVELHAVFRRFSSWPAFEAIEPFSQ